jgi:NitT/TauT family transport system ATP-binding protein
MRQRVALARAFAIRPVLLLADEAFGHLDEVTAAALRGTFLELARTEGSTAVFVTHQLEEAIEMGDRILVFGKPARLLADLRVTDVPLDGLPALRARIQSMLQTNDPDLEPTTERTHR